MTSMCIAMLFNREVVNGKQILNSFKLFPLKTCFFLALCTFVIFRQRTTFEILYLEIHGPSHITLTHP